MGFGVKYQELYDPGTGLEFAALIKSLQAFLAVSMNEDGTLRTEAITIASPDLLDNTLAFVTVGNSSSLTSERALIGTTNQVTVTDNGAGLTVQLGTPQDIAVGSSPTFASISIGDLPGAATTARAITKKVTGIADNVATGVLTVTIPNANHAGALRLLFLSSNGSTDAFESSRAAQGLVVFQRNTGVVAVATAAGIADGVIATNATGGSATHTLAYAVSAVSGAAGASNIFTINVTVDDSGNLGSNQVVLFAELLNAQATGVTIA